MMHIANTADDHRKIQGVLMHRCSVFPDERGSFCEVFRSSWPEKANYHSQIQLNLSRTAAGSLRGLHFHRRQSDWWIQVRGTIQAALADLRLSSPTFGETMVFTFADSDNTCLFVPPGVAHGFLALTDVDLLYAVDRYYDGSDEQGVTWDDPSLAIPWKNAAPVLSQRDRTNHTIEYLRRNGLLPE